MSRTSGSASANGAVIEYGDPWQMMGSMVVVGVFCALLIVSVFLATEPVIARNKAEALDRAVFEVLPAATAKIALILDGGTARPATSTSVAARGQVFYAGLDRAGELVGVAIEAAGMGYQDTIRVLYGVSLAEQTIIGIAVLESRETPGLGDRIETDPVFLRNFERLDVALTEDGASILHPIEVTKSGSKQNPWEIDGLTGATISSQAIGRMLRESSASWLPKLDSSRHQLEQLQLQPVSEEQEGDDV